MKRLLFLLFVCFSSLSAYAQNYSEGDLTFLNKYKYIYLREISYSSGEYTNSTREYEYAFNALSTTGLVVLRDSTSLPAEVQEKPCLMLKADFLFSDWGNNTLGLLTFQNCLLDLEYREDFLIDISGQLDKNVMVLVTRLFKSFRGYRNYSYYGAFTPRIPYTEQTGIDEESCRLELKDKELNQIEGIYKTIKGKEEYRLGVLSADEKFKIIVLNNIGLWKIGEVMGVIEPSSIPEVYSIDWYNEKKQMRKCFGTLDKGVFFNIHLAKDTLVLIKMYPSSNTRVNKSTGNNLKATGSGFLLTSNGIIATNSHVIEGASRIEVVISNDTISQVFSAEIKLNDSNNDVALIQIKDLNFHNQNAIPYGISNNGEIGSNVFTIGYPLSGVMGKNSKVSNGIIAASSGINDDIRYYQITVPLQPGNSGGPLFDGNGNVVGITSAKLNEKAVGTSVENVNYAIKSTYLSNLCNMLPERFDLTPKSGLQGKSLEEQIKVLKNYVCLVKVY
jgi:S1-C subfamily serine protease